jgi:hypothetical protein
MAGLALNMHQSCRTTVSTELLTFSSPLYSMKPSSRKLIHEKTYSGASRAYHSRQRLLADLRDYRLGLRLLAVISQQQEHARQPLFAGVEELVHQILLNPNIAGEQMMKQQIRERWLFMKHADHARFLKPHDRTL